MTLSRARCSCDPHLVLNCYSWVKVGDHWKYILSIEGILLNAIRFEFRFRYNCDKSVSWDHFLKLGIFDISLLQQTWPMIKFKVISHGNGIIVPMMMKIYQFEPGFHVGLLVNYANHSAILRFDTTWLLKLNGWMNKIWYEQKLNLNAIYMIFWLWSWCEIDRSELSNCLVEKWCQVPNVIS